MPLVQLPDGIAVQVRTQRAREALDNAPNLFMIHSTWTDAAMYDRQFVDAALAGEVNLYAINLVGFEGSSRADREDEVDLDWHAAVVCETIGALGIAPCHILGHGLGAAIAQRVAWRSPDVVASLILMALWTPEESPQSIAQTEAFFAASVADKTGDFRREHVVRSVLAGLGPDLSPDETRWWLDTVQRIWFERDEEEWVAWSRIRLDLQLGRTAIPPDDLQRMGVRTLVVHSELDPAIKLEIAEANTAALPSESASLLVLPAAYHYGQYTHYELLDESMLNFMRGNPVAGARKVLQNPDEIWKNYTAVIVNGHGDGDIWGIAEAARADTTVRRETYMRDWKTYPVVVQITTVTEVYSEPAGSSLRWLSDEPASN